MTEEEQIAINNIRDTGPTSEEKPTPEEDSKPVAPKKTIKSK